MVRIADKLAGIEVGTVAFENYEYVESNVNRTRLDGLDHLKQKHKADRARGFRRS
jgi:hypothetical protein